MFTSAVFVKQTAPSVAREPRVTVSFAIQSCASKKHFGSSTSAEQLNGIGCCGARRCCGDVEMSFGLTMLC